MKETSKETFTKEDENRWVAQELLQGSVRPVFQIHQGFVTLSTDMDGKERAAAPLLTHCKRRVAKLPNCMLIP